MKNVQQILNIIITTVKLNVSKRSSTLINPLPAVHVPSMYQAHATSCQLECHWLMVLASVF